MINPAPKLWTVLPLGSSLTIGSTLDPAHELLPQRSPTQRCLPSESTWRALTEPHARPLGSIPQLRTVSYGLGSEFTGGTLACSGGPDWPRCARSAPVPRPRSAAQARTTMERGRVG